MSAWKSTRVLAGLCGLALLAGCMEGAGPQASASSPGKAFSRSAPTRMAVADGAVVVAGPDGYCIDKPASRRTGGGGFVLLASCTAVMRSAYAPRPQAPALLTASVTAEGLGTAVADQAERLTQFFKSAEGRAALARDGRAESVRILDSFARDGAFFIRASDSSAGIAPGLKDDYWRAIFDVNGRMVSASVMGFQDRPISIEAGEHILRAFAHKIQSESATQL